MRTSSLARVALHCCCLSMALVVPGLRAQGPRFDARLSLPPPITGQGFGTLAAQADDLALVTVADAGPDPARSLALFYVRTPSGWELEASIEPEGIREGNVITAVALSPNRAVLTDSNQASVWVYARTADGWSLEDMLVPQPGFFTATFGEAVDIAGDRILTSAPHESSPEAGAAYVFRKGDGSWELEARLVPDVPPPASSLFGQAVALSNDRALVYYPRAFMPAEVYVFVRNGTSWQKEAILFGPQPLGGDQFGHSVSISGDWAVVGAHHDDTLHSQSGAAYVYARTAQGWVLETKLLPIGPRAATDFHFGEIVRISGDRIMAGTTSGAAFVFARGPSGWFQEARLSAPDVHPAIQTFFGRALGLSRDRAVVGADLYDPPVGAAFTYLLRPPDPVVGNDLALHGGRFRVTATWHTTSANGTGTGVQLTDQSVYFWFFDPSNAELSVKVLDACSTAFHNFWVFASGQTNVGVELSVRDTVTGSVRTYTNPDQTAFAPIQDTAAFSGCPQ